MKYSTTVQSISAQQLVALSEAFPGIRVRPSDNRYLSIEWRDDVKDMTIQTIKLFGAFTHG